MLVVSPLMVVDDWRVVVDMVVLLSIAVVVVWDEIDSTTTANNKKMVRRRKRQVEADVTVIFGSWRSRSYFVATSTVRLVWCFSYGVVVPTMTNSKNNVRVRAIDFLLGIRRGIQSLHKSLLPNDGCFGKVSEWVLLSMCFHIIIKMVRFEYCSTSSNTLD